VGALGFTVGGRGYVGFGSVGDRHDSHVFAYDPTCDAWSPLDGDLRVALAADDGATVLTAGDRVFVGNGALDAIETGTISGGSIAWSETLRYPEASFDLPLQFSDGVRAYWGGGLSPTSGDLDEFSHSFYRLDPAGNGSWRAVAGLPSALTWWAFQVEPFIIGDRAFVMNGDGGGQRMWIYAFATDTWRAVAFPGFSGHGRQAASFTIDDVAYVLHADGTLFSVRYEGPNPYAD
jgi:hypothetical protein